MDRIKTTEGDAIVRDGRFAIVAARFNEFVVESLIKGALRTLRQHGADDGNIEIFRVPGSFEMGIAIDKVAATRRFDGIIALGAVIRGGTPHFDYVSSECVKGISAAQLKHGVPIGNGVLTVDTIEQAIERAGTKAGNKGHEAAISAIEMVGVYEQLGAPDRS